MLAELHLRQHSYLPALMIIAIDSLQLGPALGGCRLWHYDNSEAAMADAEELARAMTLKAAASDLDYGGGKAVIDWQDSTPPNRQQRQDLFVEFGRLVEELAGNYITAEDVGTGPKDMALIRRQTQHVTGLGQAGDPSPWTAFGVEQALNACLDHHQRDITQCKIALEGLGAVGHHLLERLRRRGAAVLVSDIRPEAEALAVGLGADFISPPALLERECDVFIPCALGGSLTTDRLEQLEGAIVCGAANNQLSDNSLIEGCLKKNITWAPDFIANAGGLIHVALLHQGRTTADGRDRIEQIYHSMSEILKQGPNTLTTAMALAQQRLGHE